VTIGNVEITALQDTPFLMSPRVLVPEHAEEMLAEYANELDARQLLMNSITTYLLRSAGKNILVDTGVGGRRRPGMPPGKLDETLKSAGISPSDIDIVVHTHLHIDHVGWNTVDDEQGRNQVFFDRARFLIQQTEWDHWMTPEMLSEPRNLHLVECVKPLGESGRIDLQAGEVAIDENLTFIATPGHTAGHVAIGIVSAGERAVIIGDASHHPVHLLHPDWQVPLDNDRVQAAGTRARLFARAEAEDRVLIAGHWTYPGVGRIVRLDGKRTFRAL
jgi:glyoxylase-like metal-dependent hydrolase (beta-lactamase superfamily II)